MHSTLVFPWLFTTSRILPNAVFIFFENCRNFLKPTDFTKPTQRHNLNTIKHLRYGFKICYDWYLRLEKVKLRRSTRRLSFITWKFFSARGCSLVALKDGFSLLTTFIPCESKYELRMGKTTWKNPFLILWNYVLTHAYLFKHLIASVTITSSFSLCRAILRRCFPSVEQYYAVVFLMIDALLLFMDIAVLRMTSFWCLYC